MIKDLIDMIKSAEHILSCEGDCEGVLCDERFHDGDVCLPESGDDVKKFRASAARNFLDCFKSYVLDLSKTSQANKTNISK